MVPEAPINEHRNVLLGEDDVGADQASVDTKRIVLAEAKTSGMESRTHSQFE